MGVGGGRLCRPPLQRVPPRTASPAGPHGCGRLGPEPEGARHAPAFPGSPDRLGRRAEPSGRPFSKLPRAGGCRGRLPRPQCGAASRLAAVAPAVRVGLRHRLQGRRCQSRARQQGRGTTAEARRSNCEDAPARDPRAQLGCSPQPIPLRTDPCLIPLSAGVDFPGVDPAHERTTLSRRSPMPTRLSTNIIALFPRKQTQNAGSLFFQSPVPKRAALSKGRAPHSPAN